MNNILSATAKSNKSKIKNSPSPTKRKAGAPGVFDYQAPKRTPDKAVQRKLQSTAGSRGGSISSHTTPAKRAATRPQTTAQSTEISPAKHDSSSKKARKRKSATARIPQVVKVAKEVSSNSGIFNVNINQSHSSIFNQISNDDPQPAVVKKQPVFKFEILINERVGVQEIEITKPKYINQIVDSFALKYDIAS